MMRVHIVVEGPTEEAFVKDVLYRHLAPAGLFLNPILAPNKWDATARIHRGGGAVFGPALRAIHRKLAEDAGAYCTTLFDYYALPPDFPGLQDPTLPPPAHLLQRIAFLEQALDTATGSTGRLIPHLQVHEFEALLFSGVEAVDDTLTALGGSASKADNLRAIVHQAGSPEAINDGPTTAPSKRLRALYPAYNKVVFGPLIADTIGLPAIRAACPHFHAWLCRIEALATGRVARQPPTRDGS